MLCCSVWGKLASANTRRNLITTAAQQRRFQKEIERIAAGFSLRLRPPPPGRAKVRRKLAAKEACGREAGASTPPGVFERSRSCPEPSSTGQDAQAAINNATRSHGNASQNDIIHAQSQIGRSGLADSIVPSARTSSRRSLFVRHAEYFHRAPPPHLKKLEKAFVGLKCCSRSGGGFEAPNVVQIPHNVKICVSAVPISRDGDA